MINASIGYCQIGEKDSEAIPGHFRTELFSALRGKLPERSMSLVLHRSGNLMYHVLFCPDHDGLNLFGIILGLNGMCLIQPEAFLVRAFTLVDRLCFSEPEVRSFADLYPNMSSPDFRGKLLSLRREFEADVEDWQAMPLDTFDYGKGRGDILYKKTEDIDDTAFLGMLQSALQSYRYVVFPLDIQIPEDAAPIENITEIKEEYLEGVPADELGVKGFVSSSRQAFPERSERPYTYSHSSFDVPIVPEPRPERHLTDDQENYTRPKGAIQYFFSCYTKKFLSFRGKSSRKELWSFLILTGFVYLGLQYLPNYVLKYSAQTRDHLIIAINAFVGLGMVFPLIGLMVRRLHDLHLSGWYLLVVAILPVIGYSLKYFGELPMFLGLIVSVAFIVVLIAKILFARGEI